MTTRSLLCLLVAVLLSLSSALAEKQQILPEEFQAAVTKLNEIGVISDPQYWMDSAVPGKTLPSSSMAEIVIAAAGKFESVGTIEEAINVLNRQKILGDTERWKHELIDKSSFPGGDAQFLIVAFAKKIN